MQDIINKNISQILRHLTHNDLIFLSFSNYDDLKCENREYNLFFAMVNQTFCLRNLLRASVLELSSVLESKYKRTDRKNHS